jgi:hypothetical protein
MAKMTEDQIRDMFAPHLQEGEVVQHMAFGVKQPNMLLIILLFCCFILPGAIAVVLLTKNFFIATTNSRFIVLQVKGLTKLETKSVTEYSLDELRGADITTSTGALFTKIRVNIAGKPFAAKCHRAFSASNRPNAIAICDTISGKKAV